MPTAIRPSFRRRGLIDLFLISQRRLARRDLTPRQRLDVHLAMWGGAVFVLAWWSLWLAFASSAVRSVLDDGASTALVSQSAAAAASEVSSKHKMISTHPQQ